MPKSKNSHVSFENFTKLVDDTLDISQAMVLVNLLDEIYSGASKRNNPVSIKELVERLSEKTYEPILASPNKPTSSNNKNTDNNTKKDTDNDTKKAAEMVRRRDAGNKFNKFVTLNRTWSEKEIFLPWLQNGNGQSKQISLSFLLIFLFVICDEVTVSELTKLGSTNEKQYYPALQPILIRRFTSILKREGLYPEEYLDLIKHDGAEIQLAFESFCQPLSQVLFDPELAITYEKSRNTQTLTVSPNNRVKFKDRTYTRNYLSNTKANKSTSYNYSPDNLQKDFYTLNRHGMMNITNPLLEQYPLFAQTEELPLILQNKRKLEKIPKDQLLKSPIFQSIMTSVVDDESWDTYQEMFSGNIEKLTYEKKYHQYHYTHDEIEKLISGKYLSAKMEESLK